MAERLALTRRRKIEALKELFRWMCILHPPPWTIEHDWTYEVHAQDGTILAKCSDPEDAETLVALANRHIAESKKFGEGFDKALRADEKNPGAMDRFLKKDLRKRPYVLDGLV